MVQLQWKDRYNIGYREIDTQHRSLLDIVNELAELAERREASERVTHLFRRLCDYALVHFATEERCMAACGHEGLEAHREEHRFFIARLLELDEAYDPSDPKLAEQTFAFVKGWYLDHIIRSDQDYAPALRGYVARARVKAIVFDFGNVLSRFDNRRFVKQLAILAGRDEEELYRLVYAGSRIALDYESGALSSKDFLAGISALIERELEETAFVQAFMSIFEPIESSLELVRRLKLHYRLGLISNTNPWHFEHAIQTLPVFPLFDAVTVSYQVGALKPDSRLYEDVVGKLGVLAEECIFIDDIDAYVEGAEACGMKGVHYTKPEALVEDLRSLGVQV